MADRHAWRGESKGPTTAAVSRPTASTVQPRSKKLFLLAASCLALVGIIVAFIVLVQPPPAPYFVPICITEYKSRHYPVNALANQDREALLRKDGPFSNLSANAFSSQEKQLLVQELKHLASRAEPVVIYLSAFMMVDPAGDLVLLPADANPDQPGSWLRFSDVLQDLKACPSKHKVLIIDAMRPIAGYRIGVLANDLTGRVKAALDQVPDPNRFILCSCSPGQTASASEPMRQSVFGFYVDEGLRGWADGYNTEQKTDGRVSVQELGRFVRARVDRWARINRNARQTPVLWGDAEDFDLAVLANGEPIPPRVLPPAEAYPDWLAKGWAVRDQWWADERFRLVPNVFRELEATLIHAEQQWRGGVEAARVQADLQKQLDAFNSQLAQAKRATPRPEPKSLLLALRHRPPSPPAPEPAKDAKDKEAPPPPITAKEVRQLLTKLDEVSRGLKPEEASAARQKITDEFSKRFEKLPAIEQAQYIFEVLVDDTFPTPDKVTYLYGFLRQTQPLPLYIETLFLRRLDDLAAQKTQRPWPTDAVRRALTTLREGEKAQACDARIAPWVRSALTRAAQQRHDAETLLFARGSASMEEADRLFQEAIRQYQAINGSIEILETALRTYDEALAILPGAVPYFMARSDSDSRDEQSWAGALEMVQAVSGFFSETPDKLSADDLQKRIGELQQNADLLRVHISNLTRGFTTDLERLLKLARRLDTPDPEVLLYFELILQTPWLKAKDRLELYNAGRALAGKLHENTRALDEKENTGRRVTDLLPDFDRQRAEKEEQERAGRRGQVTVDLLKLGGFPADQAVKDLGEARRHSSFAKLAHELRRAWADQLATQLAELSELPAKARLARISAPFDRVPLLADIGTNPQVALHKARNAAQLGWLGDRYRYARRDLPGMAEGRDRLVFSFYDEASRLYLQDATEPPAEVYLAFSPIADALDFRSEKQSASTKMQLRLVGPPGTVAEGVKDIRPVGIINDWVQVTIPETKLAGPGPWDVPLEIQFRPAGGGTDPVPAEGFLVQATLGDRHFHSRVSLLPPIPDSQRLQILVSDSPKEPATSLAELRLRPNQKQSVHVFVRNPSDSPRKVMVELKAEGVPPATSEPLEIGPKETKKVAFGKPMPADPKAPELPELKGTMQLRLVEAEKKAVLDEKRLRVSIAQPREYVRVSNIRYEPGEQNKLVVQVRSAGRIEGPPCRVQLVLPRERIPGFVKAESGTFEGLLQGSGEIVLAANSLLFEDAADENGYVYLTVDGYERAFIFRITFARRGTGVAPQEVLRPELRIQAPRFLPPNVVCPVKLETDNSQAGANLEIGLERGPAGNFTLEPLLEGDRRQRVGFAAVGPEGTLFFETAVSDWSLPLNMAGIVGTRDIRARILDSRGGEITRVLQPVTIDDTAPVDLKILQIGDSLIGEGVKSVQVTPNPLLPVIAEGTDPNSGIDQVVFYLGKPKENKFDPAVPKMDGQPLNAERTRWKALLPADREGATDLTIQFVNKVGLTSLSRTVTLLIQKEEDPKLKKAKPGSIVGTVLEGTRPQPSANVILIDPRAQATDKPKTTKTDANGVFEFTDLEPGAYKVQSSKPVTGRKGESTAIVKPGEATKVTISLLQ